MYAYIALLQNEAKAFATWKMNVNIINQTNKFKIDSNDINVLKEQIKLLQLEKNNWLIEKDALGIYHYHYYYYQHHHHHHYY